jgi:hypothetical protein
MCTNFLHLIAFQFIHLSSALRVLARFLRHHQGRSMFRFILNTHSPVLHHTASCSISLNMAHCLSVGPLFDFRGIKNGLLLKHLTILSEMLHDAKCDIRLASVC